MHVHPELEEADHKIQVNRSRDTVLEVPEEANQMVQDIQDAAKSTDNSQSTESSETMGKNHVISRYKEFLNLNFLEHNSTSQANEKTEKI